MATEGTPGVRRSARGEALELRLANPPRANALTPDMLDDLVAVLGGAQVRSARVVLLGGEGERHFSSGLDLAGGDTEALDDRLRNGERLLGVAARAIEACPRPVVAVVGGPAVGGALELAAACDWRIASTGATFAMPAGRLGVVYTAEGLARFLSLLGPARTRRLFLTGAPIGADEAFGLGLVDQLVEPGAEPWAVAREVAGEIAASAPRSVEGVRRILAAMPGVNPDEARRIAEELRDEAYASNDYREGLAAFSERRGPRFDGG